MRESRIVGQWLRVEQKGSQGKVARSWVAKSKEAPEGKASNPMVVTRMGCKSRKERSIEYVRGMIVRSSRQRYKGRAGSKLRRTHVMVRGRNRRTPMNVVRQWSKGLRKVVPRTRSYMGTVPYNGTSTKQARRG